MTAAETATKANPATVDAAPYFAKQHEDPEYRAAYAQAEAEIRFVDNVVRAVIEKSRELGVSTKYLAEQSCSSERRVRRLLAGHPEKVDFCTVVAAAAALGIGLSVHVGAHEPIAAAN